MLITQWFLKVSYLFYLGKHIFRKKFSFLQNWILWLTFIAQSPSCKIWYAHSPFLYNLICTLSFLVQYNLICTLSFLVQYNLISTLSFHVQYNLICTLSILVQYNLIYCKESKQSIHYRPNDVREGDERIMLPIATNLDRQGKFAAMISTEGLDNI